MAIVLRKHFPLPLPACGDLCSAVGSHPCMGDGSLASRKGKHRRPSPDLFSDLAPDFGKEMLETLISAFPATELLLEM